ncbi:hypothetical protein SprV_0200738600 [Sparganum proliferum]
MPDLAGLDDVTNCTSPHVTILGSRSGQLNPFPSPKTETEYRMPKNHVHVLTKCAEPVFELTHSSTPLMGQRCRIEGSNTELLKCTTKNMPDVVAASADCLI